MGPPKNDEYQGRLCRRGMIVMEKTKNTQRGGREAEKMLARNNELGPEKDTTKMVIYD